MIKNKITNAVLAISCVTAVSIVIYLLYDKHNSNNFSCSTSLSQHYASDKLDVSLNYSIRGESGFVSINGYWQSEPDKILNRKISFSVQKKDDIYYMTSNRNLKFPDDNVSDSWLSQFEPDFFVYEKKSIYMKIIKQSNDNYLFMTNSIPTYICKTNKNS